MDMNMNDGLHWIKTSEVIEDTNFGLKDYKELYEDTLLSREYLESKITKLKQVEKSYQVACDYYKGEYKDYEPDKIIEVICELIQSL
jgi:hypothetical protein